MSTGTVVGYGQPLVLATGRQVGFSGHIPGDYSIAVLDDVIAIQGFAGACVSPIFLDADDPVPTNQWSFVFWEDGFLNAALVHFDGTFSWGDAQSITVGVTPVIAVSYLKRLAAGGGQVFIARILNGTPSGSLANYSSATVLANGQITGFGSGVTALGALIVTSTTTAYMLYQDSGGIHLGKTTGLGGTGAASAGDYTWTSKTVTGATALVDGGLVKIGSTLYVVAAVGSSYKVLSSADDGTTWSVFSTIGATSSITRPRATFKSASVWAVAYVSAAGHPNVALSVDGGATWTASQVSTDTATHVSVYVVHSSHILVQYIASGGHAQLRYYESIDRGQAWLAVPTQLPFGEPPDLLPPSTADFGVQAKMTRSGACSGGLDGSITDLATPGSNYVTTIAAGTFGSVWEGFVGYWAVPDRVDPDTFEPSGRWRGPTFELRAAYGGSGGTRGPTFELIASYVPSGARGPTFEISSVSFKPILAQDGFSNIVKATSLAQDGFADIYFLKTLAQQGHANIRPLSSPPIDSTVTRRSDGGWHFEWAASFPPYSIYLDGLLIATATTESFDFRRPHYEDAPPDIEIRDAEAVGLSENEANPPYVLIQWRGVQEAKGYVVQRWTGAAWSTVSGPILERRKGYYTYQSSALDDDASYLFRVVPVDLGGNFGASIEFEFRIVRNPRHPDVDVEAGSSGAITVSN